MLRQRCYFARYGFFLLFCAPVLADLPHFSQSSAFKGVVISVVALNKAMREAAMSPLSEPLRDNVRNAVNALSFSLSALASEYKQVKLDPFQFPQVQAILGSFVDVNAPDLYQRFLINPDARLIPKVGPGFPEKLDAAPLPGGPAPERVGPSSVSSSAVAMTPDPKFEDPTRIGLKDSAEPKGKYDPQRIGFDDSAKVSAEIAIPSEVKRMDPNGAPTPLRLSETAAASVGGALTQAPAVTKELLTIEERLREAVEKTDLDAEIFPKKRRSQKAPARTRPRLPVSAASRLP